MVILSYIIAWKKLTWLCGWRSQTFFFNRKRSNSISLFKQDFMDGTKQKGRCDLVSHLIKRGCRSDFIESPKVDIILPNNDVNVQVTPGEISIQLYPGLLIKKKIIIWKTYNKHVGWVLLSSREGRVLFTEIVICFLIGMEKSLAQILKYQDLSVQN